VAISGVSGLDPMTDLCGRARDCSTRCSIRTSASRWPAGHARDVRGAVEIRRAAPGGLGGVLGQQPRGRHEARGSRVRGQAHGYGGRSALEDPPAPP
jgi:hypothetical protein